MDREEKTYGGCEGPDAMYVRCISPDGHEFIVKREHALTSGMIKAMLSGPGQFAENETSEINFREIPSHVLSKVCMYFTYKVGYTNSDTEIPEFPISPEIALELLMAVNKINHIKLLTLFMTTFDTEMLHLSEMLASCPEPFWGRPPGARTQQPRILGVVDRSWDQDLRPAPHPPASTSAVPHPPHPSPGHHVSYVTRLGNAESSRVGLR
nr:elongin-C-like [Saimiri boliviensis boliviensis]